MMKISIKTTFVIVMTIVLSVATNFIEGGIFSNHNSVFAKTNSSVWNDISERNFSVKGERRIIPSQYRTVKANINELKMVLNSAPFELTDRAKSNPVTIELPMPDGSMSKFFITEYSMMEPGLAAKFPEFKTYTIKGIDDPYATGKIDITLKGFHAMVLTVRGNYFIDPYSSDEKGICISYFKRDAVRTQDFECFTETNLSKDNTGFNSNNGTITTGNELRSYRLALAATGEYTIYHGGTVPQGMAAIVTAMNRVNGVYETDIAVRMILVANNDQIVYTNGSTDPYSNNNGGTMLGQNQTNLDNVIGSANYDVGHVFSTGGGGVAYLGCVCSGSSKARGVTGLPSPIGDPFYIDYVAHEMGHQFGGNHSFNSVASSCGGGNRNASTAWEPGSGSTIMGYAGICGSDNLQNNSDALFHSGNFSEMAMFTQLGNGGICAVVTPSGNTHPVVTVPAGGFTIPISTPFSLKGSATDAENPNSLTYIWEEMDLGPAGSPNNPSGNAPIFRSFKPDTSSTRIFPKLSNLLNNSQTIGERLPTYSRDLTFRLTVRDNNAGCGGVDYEQIAFQVSSAAGPFLVTQPNTNVSWNSNIPQTVTWDVANTTAAPVSCSSVSIKLSTDGGVTFPVSLAANTPNDGSETVNLPSINFTTCRIKVESVGNVFFDLSNVNFTVTNQVSIVNNGSGIPDEYSLSQNFPNPFNPVTKINFDLPFNSNVKLVIMDITGKEVASVLNQGLAAGSYSFNFNAGALASGIYFYRLAADGSGKNFVMTRKMTIIK